MGVMGFCAKFGAVLVVVFAVLLGAIVSGALKATGFFRYMDTVHTSRGQLFRGMFPDNHEGTPWGFTEADIPHLGGETVLVTGGNVGLGYWTAWHLANKKATVIIGCRNQVKCDAAAASIQAATGTKVHTALLDLASFVSIRACAAAVSAAHPAGLDSLILNAGVMIPPFSKTEEGLELQIGVNHFGHFLLTKLLLPQLEAKAKANGLATVVSVSSSAHYDSYPEGILPTIEQMNNETTYKRDSAYGQSKLANVLFAQELSARLKGKNILVNSVHPGFVDTQLIRHAHTVVSKLSASLADHILTCVNGLAWAPRDAALTQIYAAVGPSLRKNKVTGRYFHPIARENTPDLHAQDKEMQGRLWAMTEAFINKHKAARPVINKMML